MASLTFITGNLSKAEQLSRHLDYPVDYKKLDVHEIQSLNLEEVAIHKAKEAYKIMGSPVLVEDTSLIFNALGSLPGPLIKWFLESLDNEGLAKILNSYDDRTAHAEVCFAYCDENGAQTFSGSIDGTIANEPRGEKGFGWDPVFIPEGYDITWGEMDADQQKETSMRRIALRKLQTYLEAIGFASSQIASK
jgi:non-canonical purine NTP pyrophosphatase (RdgB/HAM1 family)